jgi:phosphoribosyl-dephospho-CoA transferase
LRLDANVGVGVLMKNIVLPLVAYVAQELITIFSGSPCRVDAQLETPRGALSLAEYGRGETPLLLRQAGGPVLVDDPWARR